jgi:hypothetical protein
MLTTIALVVLAMAAIITAHIDHIDLTRKALIFAIVMLVLAIGASFTFLFTAP